MTSANDEAHDPRREPAPLASGKLGMRLQSSTPAELQTLLAGEIKRWGEVIRAAKIEPE